MRTAFAATDAAHATQTLFHVAHSHLFQTLSKDHLFVSLHGKTKASFIVSDGTALDAPMPAAAWPSMRFAALLHSEIARRVRELENSAITEDDHGEKLAVRRKMSFPVACCNGAIAGVVVRRTIASLCGTTNVQLRMANGADDPCKLEAHLEDASGKMVHVEQPDILISSEIIQKTLEAYFLFPQDS